MEMPHFKEKIYGLIVFVPVLNFVLGREPEKFVHNLKIIINISSRLIFGLVKSFNTYLRFKNLVV